MTSAKTHMGRDIRDSEPAARERMFEPVAKLSQSPGCAMPRSGQASLRARPPVHSSPVRFLRRRAARAPRSSPAAPRKPRSTSSRQLERPGPTRRTPRRTPGSYTTDRDTIAVSMARRSRRAGSTQQCSDSSQKRFHSIREFGFLPGRAPFEHRLLQLGDARQAPRAYASYPLTKERNAVAAQNGQSTDTRGCAGRQVRGKGRMDGRPDHGVKEKAGPGPDSPRHHPRGTSLHTPPQRGHAKKRNQPTDRHDRVEKTVEDHSM